MSESLLQGRRIAVPESRQLDVLARIIEERGGEVWRVPLVGIKDAPDPAPIIAWLDRFCAEPPNLFVILTGEGLRRLLALAGKNGRHADFVATLGKVPTLCRGPKPGRALAEVDLKPAMLAAAPTTDGVIETLGTLPLENSRVAVQLYGEDPNLKLMEFLASRQARAFPVAPYVYADDSEEQQVLHLIQGLAEAKLDAIAFTSQPQLKRLFQVARKHGLEENLRNGLKITAVAAVGPVVRDQLEAEGILVQIMPERSYFMKPLVTAMVKHFSAQ